ncbi:polysaccharide biosynthesis tyrosine autokinase [soil metagenome]
MELRDYIRVVRRHWFGMLLIVAVTASIAGAWSITQPKVYTASTSPYVTVNDGDGGSQDVGLSLAAQQLATAKVDSFVTIGSWRAVAETVIDELDLDTTPEALVTRVGVTSDPDTVNIQVSASAPTPEEARDIAEAWVRAMIAQIDDVEGNGKAGSATVNLVAGDLASLPSVPSSPKPRRDIALGIAVGLLLAFGYAVVRNTLDRRIRSALEVERQTGLAVLGAIPNERRLSGGSVEELTGAGGGNMPFALQESMRELRTNLQFIDVDHQPRVIVITSPAPGDGKSTIAANLALALAANGQRTWLVDCDLRRPSLIEKFGLVKGAGLTDVLAGRIDIDDVAQSPDPALPLMVVGTGRLPPNPSEVLGSDRMRYLVNQLSQDAIVLLDAPPALPVTDAAVLSHHADGVFIVARAKVTTYDILERAHQVLERAKATTFGVVLNKVPTKGADAEDYYGYRYASYKYESKSAD